MIRLRDAGKRSARNFIDDPPAIQSTLWILRIRSSSKVEALKVFLTEARKNLGMTQAEVARRLNRYQSYVATVESGQRRIGVVEFLDFAEAIGFDPRSAIRRLT
jgi:hypothetical protein